MAEIVIGNLKALPLVQDSLLPSGKRAITRTFRPSNASDPGLFRRVEWEISGEIGYSLESLSGRLATDYVQNLETRHLRRLMSAGARTAVDITGSPVTDSGAYGSMAYGSPSSAWGGTEALFGTSDSSGDVINYMDEQQGYLFAHHGAISTQLNLSTWAEVENYIHANIITDAIDWRSFGWVAFSAGKAVAKRTAVTSTGSTYTDVGSVAGQYARKFAVGSDRLWVATGVNQVTYTNNVYTTFATAFEIGDHDYLANGIGCHGPYTRVGKQSGIYSFTDLGKPVPESQAMASYRSPLTGAQWADPGWGWHYYTTASGLRAISQSGVDNPVGIGEAMPQFTGHAGPPTALWTHGGQMYVAYLVGTNTYIYRCLFDPQLTPATGQFKMYPFHYLASTQCNRGFSSLTTDAPTIIWGEDGDVAYEEVSIDLRDDLWSDRTYSTSGGVWYGTTLDRDNHLLKVLRKARIRVLNVEPCSTWQLAFTFDVNPWDSTPTWIDCGPELDVEGYWDLIPAQGDRPLDFISGRNFKPRLTQTADGPHASTLPPEVNGVLEVEYDERPDNIETVQVVVQTPTDSDLRKLEAMASERSDGPVRVTVDGKRQWAMVASVGPVKDIAPDGVAATAIELHIWETR